MAFPFTLAEVIIAIGMFYAGAVTFHYFLRVFVPRQNLTTLNQARNLSLQAAAFSKSLQPSTTTPPDQTQGSAAP